MLACVVDGSVTIIIIAGVCVVALAIIAIIGKRFLPNGLFKNLLS